MHIYTYTHNKQTHTNNKHTQITNTHKYTLKHSRKTYILSLLWLL